MNCVLALFWSDAFDFEEHFNLLITLWGLFKLFQLLLWCLWSFQVCWFMFSIYIYLSFFHITLLIIMALLLTNYFTFNDDVIEDVLVKRNMKCFWKLMNLYLFMTFHLLSFWLILWLVKTSWMHINKEIEDAWNLEVNVDEEVLNVHFWNLKSNEVENIKITSWKQSCYSYIWDVNVFNSWCKTNWHLVVYWRLKKLIQSTW